MSSMFLTVSLSAATTVLSAPSSMISPSFSSACAWVSFIFLVRSFSASSLRAASSAGPWLARLALCADSCRLAASRGNVASAEVDHGPAEMAEHEAGAGRDHDGHAGDDGEGGKQAAADAELRKAETLRSEFADPEPKRHVSAAPCTLPWMFPRAAVSRYPVNKSGKRRAILSFFSVTSDLTGFSASWKTPQDSKKAGVRPAFIAELSLNAISTARPPGRRVEAVVDAGLDGVLVVAEVAERRQRARGHEVGVAEIVVLVLDLGRPVRGEHVFEAGADGVAVAMVLDRA